MANQSHCVRRPTPPEDEGSTGGWIRFEVEALVERLGMGLLLVLLAFTVLAFSIYMVYGFASSLHAADWAADGRPGIELAIIPLAAAVAAQWRLGADWLIALRTSRAGSYLPLLTAAALVGLIAYLLWSWETPPDIVGLDEFGVVRWLGTALTATLTFIGLLLFPRITAILAGVVTGTVLVALVGYVFFSSCTAEYLIPRYEPGILFGAVILMLLSVVVWSSGAIWLNRRARLDEVELKRLPLFHAIWSGTVMVGAASLGAVAGLAC